jgi:hypothetical protein
MKDEESKEKKRRRAIGRNLPFALLSPFILITPEVLNNEQQHK